MQRKRAEKNCSLQVGVYLEACLQGGVQWITASVTRGFLINCNKDSGSWCGRRAEIVGRKAESGEDGRRGQEAKREDGFGAGLYGREEGELGQR